MQYGIPGNEIPLSGRKMIKSRDEVALDDDQRVCLQFVEILASVRWAIRENEGVSEDELIDAVLAGADEPISGILRSVMEYALDNESDSLDKYLEVAMEAEE